MTDCHSPTIVQPAIPNTDMTPLERLLLAHIFDAEQHDDTFYYYAETGTRDCLTLPLAELRAAFAASDVPSTATTWIAERLNGVAPEDTSIELNLSVTFPGSGQRPARGQVWAFILQDIVRRSATLDYVTVVSAFTCTGMRPDGFGGMAVLITLTPSMQNRPTISLRSFLPKSPPTNPTACADTSCSGSTRRQ